MKKWKLVYAIPGDNVYLRDQAIAAESAAARLGVDLQVVNAKMDSVAQSQQLLGFVQSAAESRPDALIVEPVSAAGYPRVAEAAVAAGIAWAVSNAQVDYLAALRKNAKAPVFLVSQDHVEIGRIQGCQIGAILPDGGSVLYLRGPQMNSLASRRFEGLEGAKPKNVEVKSVKVQGSGSETAYTATCSWLGLSSGRSDGVHMVVSQNADFLMGARKAFETNTPEAERAKWLALPFAGAGLPKQMKPLVEQGVLRAAVFTSLTMDALMPKLVQALNQGSQPPEQTFVEAHSFPIVEELARPRERA
ncbi:MAG TPA: substrate-binding domain-containing protein [Candidatus Acidoferrales bacterium]|nr:substrate-binding domain-containing protein [Candidatus Acidoferrales bacterium]